MDYQKLIELLNEYQEGKGSEIRFKRIDNLDFFICGDDVGLGYETILSKKFGFIKWLVYNDKIDRDKVGETEKKQIVRIQRTIESIKILRYTTLLMLLSIQDEPIKFLLEILR